MFWPMIATMFEKNGCIDRFPDILYYYHPNADAYLKTFDEQSKCGAAAAEDEPVEKVGLPFLNFATDYAFRVPAIQVADGQKKHCEVVWMYRYDLVTKSGEESGLRASHAFELPAMFADRDFSFTKFIFDGVSDLIMGRIVDGTHSKFGRARSWLMRMCIPLAISVVLLFSIPSSFTGIIKYVYIFLIYNLVNTVFYTAMFVPYNALISLMTSDSYEHGMLGNISMIFQTIANIAMNTFFMTMVLKLGNVMDLYTPEAQAGWTKATIVVGLFIIASALLCFFGTKERTAVQPRRAKRSRRTTFPSKSR